MLTILLARSVAAEEVVLRNDTAYDDTFDNTDSVAWLGYPECAAIVLDPAPEDYPLEIHTVLVFLGSSQGNQDHAVTFLTMGIDILEEGESPTLPGYSEWALPESPFQVTVSSTRLNSLSLDDPDQGLYPLTVTSGDVAIWVCAPDPADEYYPAEWPYADLASDTSGLVIDGGAPSGGSWVHTGSEMYALSDLGAEGSWVIRAVSGYDEAVSLGLSAVSPASATVGSAVDVTLTGSGFDADTVATIGGLPLADPTLVDDVTLTGRSPSGLPVGVHDVMVTGADGETATLPGAFSVIAPEEEEEEPDPVEDTGGADGPKPEGCGCGTGGAGPGLLGALVAAAAAVRRRGR